MDYIWQIFFFMDPIESSQISSQLPNTHAILYNNKRFPFNLNLFNIFTDYFKDHQDQIQPDQTIILVNDGKIELSENSIQVFIDFCQLKAPTITNNDIFSLYYLSKKYNVPQMIEQLEQHIFRQKDPIYQFFLYDQEDNQQKKIEYEEKISQNLNNFIENDSLLKLPIPILHRILSRATNIDQTKLENFLIKMLSKSGRNASVLFDTIDIRNASFSFTNKLVNEFSEIFDFHYINPVFMKSIHNQIIKDSVIMKEQQNDFILKISKENRKMHKEIEKLSNLVIQKEEELKRVKRILSCLYFQYGGENQAFYGIIRYLTVSCGGNVHENKVVIVTQSSFYIKNDKNAYIGQFAVDLDNKNQLNYFVTDNLPNSWIKYDFNDKKVRPTHYSIRTRPEGTFNGCHPKSWVIEGSNNGNDDDENDWKVLDERNNEEYLVGLDSRHTYDIQTLLEPNESFQYLRFRLSSVNSSGNNYIVLSALEYFGYLFCNI